MTDEEANALLERVKQRDVEAFTRLHLGCTQMINKVARSILWKSEELEDVEEVVTDTMIEVWEKPEAFAGRSNVMGWIWGIAKNKSLERRRKRMQIRDKPQDDYEELVEVKVSDFQDAIEAIERAQDSTQLHRCLERLSPKQRDVVMRRFFGDMTEKEVAEDLEVPLNTVKTRFFNASRHLLGCMQGSSPEREKGNK